MRRFLVPPASGPARTGGVPSFSVIIAAYQVADVIGDAIESVLGQTLPAHEIIVCDDGSTDDLASALAPYRERLVLVRQDNGGEGAAKNAAARRAAGDFVVILDADDTYLPERLEALGELAAERPDLDILTTDAYLEVDGRVLRRCYDESHRFETREQRKGILERNFIFGHAAVRRETFLQVGGFDETIRHTTDWECWTRMIVAAGARAGLVDEPLARYRLRPDSLSADRIRMIGGKLATLERASHLPGLTPAELDAVKNAQRRHRRELALLEAKAALAGGAADARRRSLRVALGRGVDRRSRAKAAFAAVMPGVAGRRLADEERATWTAASGVRLPRT